MDKFTALANKYLTGDDFAAAAKKLLSALRVPKPAIAILLPIVANAIRLVARDDTREAEREAFASPRSASEPGAPRTAIAWSDFLKDTFALGDGRWVKWGEATVPDHLARIEYLGLKRDGIEQTMNRHRLAVEQIQAAGVSCLNKLKQPKKAHGTAGQAATATHRANVDRTVSL